MQVRLLGPVDVVVDGQVRPVPGVRRRRLLAALAVTPGDVVGVDRLVDLVWGERPPSTVVNTLQTNMSYLRRLLGSRTTILARASGYVLNLGPTGTDAAVAERLIDDGTRATDLVERAALIRRALTLWRGPALDDFTEAAWSHHARRLHRLWLRGSQLLIEARLAVGEHRQLLPELEGLAHDHPFDEQIHGQLIVALYRCGRQADALDTYRRLRRRLSEELGIDPSPTLRGLEAAVLNQDPALDPTDPAPAVVASGPAGDQPDPTMNSGAAIVPAQLPLAVPGFVGRGRSLALLDALLPGPDDQPSRPTVVAAVSGMAGVGKTTLAVHWAHRVADRFPDGQLYVNLRGFDPSGSALDPAEAIRRFLDALGVAVTRLPAELDARAALYRSALAGRRVLMLLDNAADAEQVRPLLPGSPGCLAIVTSRDSLAGLVAIEGARPVSLDLPSEDEARDLLTERLGRDRVVTELAAVDDIVARCARLPLALAIVAARAASNSHFSLATLATELREAATALDALSGDEATDVRAVFSWSYQRLSTGAARLFRLLGLHNGAHITLAAAASLAGTDPATARRSMAELTRTHLLAEPSPGRYVQHDLLHAYATELASRPDNDADGRIAHRSLLDHYLHTSLAAASLLHGPGQFTLDPPGPAVVVSHLSDSDQAAAWMAANRLDLLAAVESAAGAGVNGHVEPLAWALSVYLDRNGYWQDQIALNQIALTVAGQRADRAAQARARRGLAGACTRLGRFEEALTHLTRALDLLHALGDRAGQGRVNLDTAQVYAQQGRYADALRHDEEALANFEAAGTRAGRAMALNGVGWCHAMLGRHDLAVAVSREAIALHRESGDRWALAATFDTLGFAQHHLGEHDAAIRSYQEALVLWRKTSDQFGTAETLDHLGDAHHDAGDAAAAAKAWRRALDILDRLAHPLAASVRAKVGVNGWRAS